MHSKQPGTFIATDPQGGSHTISVFLDFQSDHHFVGSQPYVGLTDSPDGEGTVVQRMDKGKYRVHSEFGDVLLTTEDPNAP